MLGLAYAAGKGVAQDDAEAAQWFYFATQAKIPASDDKGQPEAVKQLRKLADKGNTRAQGYLQHIAK
jgi:TPR repeat protein